jgi:preprotein translocase subunit YajC
VGLVFLNCSSGVLPVFISSAFAQTAPAAAAAGGTSSLLQGMLPMVAIVIVFYFLAIRPQMKRQKEVRTMLDALALGDEVVTSGGMLAKVTKLSDGLVHAEIASGVLIQLQRQAIVQVLPKGSMASMQ